MSLLRRFHLKNPLGVRGEDEAVRFLKKQGFTILDRNWKNRTGRAVGEIDIVAKDGSELVFVEVKARKAERGAIVLPEESITREKLRRLARAAEGYLREKKLRAAPYRFDAILLTFPFSAGETEIRHFQSIFL